MHSLNSRTSYLFKKYYNKTASLQEISELSELLRTSSDDELIKLMQEEWENLENEEAFFNADKSQEMLGNILSNEDRDVSGWETLTNTGRNWSSMFRIISVAAAMLILVSFGFYFWSQTILNPVPETAYTHTVQGAPPGGYKAVLTLADGRNITLDSAANGIIASTGSFEVIKKENGQVIYNTVDVNYKNFGEAEFNIISTPRGGEYRVILPDGSKVWLNSASSITFPGVFKGKTRTIELEGEAYFEIAKNPALPFKVKLNNAYIEVLGTHFNVRDYHDEEAMKTTLVEGSVKITGGNSSHLLKPGQQAELIGNEMKVVNDVDVEEQIAWKNGLFQFKDAEIEEVMRQAALWYDLEVSFKGEIPKKYFTGKISRSVNASEFMNMFGYTGVKFKIEGKKIVIID